MFHPNVCRHDLVLQVLKKKTEKWMSIECKRRYPTSIVSGYSKIDLLVFRDTRMILEKDKRENSCRSKISINHSTVEYIHFL